MLLLIIYHFLHAIAFVLFLPKLLLLMLCKRKYRKSFFKRFGWGVPKLKKGAVPRLWLHAVSMGEVAAARAIVSAFPERNFTFVISTTTETGQERAKHLFPDAEAIFYWPYDFFSVVRSVFGRIKPDQLILVEGDLWYGALASARSRGVSVAIANGKMSETSFNRFSKARYFTKALLSTINLFCVQSDLFKQRFIALGAPVSKIIVTGNVKFDTPITQLSSEEKNTLKPLFQGASDEVIIVAGSTHPGEEEIILNSIPSNSKLLLVPRHPERFLEVAQLLQKKGVPFERYSSLKGSGIPTKAKVCLVDTMGLLLKLYQIADIAIVAGSFSQRVGGHNILEPAQFGVPVVVGPFMFSQSAIFESAHAEAAVIQVSSQPELATLLSRLSDDRGEREMLGSQGKHFVDSMKGASKRTVDALTKLSYVL